MYCYNGAQCYEVFSQVDLLYRALILLGIALCLPSASVSSVLTGFILACVVRVKNENVKNLRVKNNGGG